MLRPSRTISFADHSIMTAEHHLILEQRKRFPSATGTFSGLLSGIILATKMTQAKVRRAGLLDLFGDTGGVNVQGEHQQKLDVFANEALLHCLRMREDVAILASEENEEPLVFDGRGGGGKYVVVFDPLDGSSNIDVNVGIGTIFSVLEVPHDWDAGSAEAAVLQPGIRQHAAGYVLYGSSTVLVFTTGHGVHVFTLDPEIGAYVLSHENIRLPASGSIYSVNEANFDSFPELYQRYLVRLRTGRLGRAYTSRYIGSLVADFHRTLIKGGVFLYPPTRTYPHGKLRLLYEANPIALIAEQAGGAAVDGSERILEIEPNDIHQRVPLIVGGKSEIEAFLHCPDIVGRHGLI